MIRFEHAVKEIGDSSINYMNVLYFEKSQEIVFS